MTHPITPPPELVQQWMKRTEYDEHTWFYESYIAEQSAQWGADQELKACCEWLGSSGYAGTCFTLRAARRPKPPSLKEQALAELAEWENVMDIAPDSSIRRALEALPK